MPTPELQASEQFQALLSRSATDPEFRARLLETPREALKEFFGREAPEGLDVAFVENRAGVTIVLPDAIRSDGELDEAELEAVAGGTSPILYPMLSLTTRIIAPLIPEREGGSEDGPSCPTE